MSEVNTGKLGLTHRQNEVLDFITAQYEATGVSPSFQEVCDVFGFKSKSHVHRIIHNLSDRGHIILAGRRARTMIPVGAQQPLSEAIKIVLRRCNLTSQTRAEIEAILANEAAE